MKPTDRQLLGAILLACPGSPADAWGEKYRGWNWLSAFKDVLNEDPNYLND